MAWKAPDIEAVKAALQPLIEARNHEGIGEYLEEIIPASPRVVKPGEEFEDSYGILNEADQGAYEEALNTVMDLAEEMGVLFDEDGYPKPFPRPKRARKPKPEAPAPEEGAPEAPPKPPKKPKKEKDLDNINPMMLSDSDEKIIEGALKGQFWNKE